MSNVVLCNLFWSLFNRRLFQLSGIGDQRKEQAFISVLRGYSKLQLLSTMYNQTVGQLLLSRIKSTAAISCVASAYMLVKLVALNDFFITSLCVCALLIFVGTFSLTTKYCSQVHHNSCELHKYLMSNRIPGREISKELECFRKVGVRIGSFFLVKRGTPLTMLAMISNTTMTMLISVNFSM